MPREAQRTLQLPESLRHRFQRLEARLWRVDLVILCCGALSGLILSYILLFISDRFWDTPRWLRLSSTLAGLAVLAYFLLSWLRLWVWKRRDYRALAGLVQRHYRRLGDRLLGIVELADERKRPSYMSADLCKAAIHQVSKEAVQFDFRQAVATRKPKIYFICAIFLAGLFTAPWVVTPQASLSVLNRWLAPVSKVPRYTFVSLEQLPALLIVPHGEPFQIQCGLSLRSVWRPTQARCQFEEQAPIEAPITGREVIFRIPGQTKPGRLVLHVGDISKQICIEPTFRPALKKMLAHIHYPDYLQHPPKQEEIRNGVLAFLEGSRLAFHGTATRALAAANLIPASNAPPVALGVQGENFQSQPLQLEDSSRCSFIWRDKLDLDAAAPWPLVLQPQKDAAPQVECPEQPQVLAMLEEEAFELRIAAQDDFGIRELGLAWEWQKRQGTNTPTREGLKIQDGAPRTKTLTASYRFSPSLLHIPGDTIISLRAVANDYLPNRKAAESPLYKIFVLSREEHAKLIEQQFEKITADIEELTRRQEGLEETTRETRNQPPEKLGDTDTAKKLGEQAAEQKAIGEKLANLEKNAETVLREAMKNKSIPSETIQQWGKHLEKMKELSEQQIPQASQNLASAQQNSPQRESQMDQALQKQKEIVEELQEMQKKINMTLDEMLANTLAQRLRKVAGTEKTVEQVLQKAVGETIGLTSEQLPPRHQEKTRQLATDQDHASQHTRQLTEEISRFHDRTGVTNYGNVAKEMKETEASDGLARTAELIRRNIAMQAIAQADEWAQRFLSWAEQLEAAKRSSEGSGGNGGGEQKVNEAALRRLLALLRLRLAEVNVRESTAWLEAHKQTHSSYTDDAIGLSLRQSLLADEAETMDKQGQSRFLFDAREAMEDADKLLRKPQTDKPTVAAETDAINLLEAEIMDMVQQPNQGQAQSAAMAMMMQMMGMQPNPSGGGNYAGGEPGDSNTNPGGDPRGTGADPRHTDRTAGRETQSVPAEFREALQNYYKAVEQLNP